MAQPGVVLEAPQDLEAVDPGHHDVEQDQVDRLAGEPLQGVAAMDRRNRLVVEQLELLRQHVAVERLVVDDQDAGRRRHLGPSRRAAHRLGRVPAPRKRASLANSWSSSIGLVR